MGNIQIDRNPSGKFTVRLADGKYLLQDGKLARFNRLNEARRLATNPKRLELWLKQKGNSTGDAPDKVRQPPAGKE